jgi:hypothetical protein
VFSVKRVFCDFTNFRSDVCMMVKPLFFRLSVNLGNGPRNIRGVFEKQHFEHPIQGLSTASDKEIHIERLTGGDDPCLYECVNAVVGETRDGDKDISSPAGLQLLNCLALCYHISHFGLHVEDVRIVNSR